MRHTARAHRRPAVLRVALVHKMPTPYRVPVFDRVAQAPGIDLTVVYSSEREPNRRWNRPDGRAKTVYLKERILDLGENKYVHLNWGVGRELRRIRPHVVITNGYNVTDLLAIAHARRHGARVVCQIDGTEESERTLTWVHRAVRRVADRFTAAYTGPSGSTLRLFRTFGAEPDAVFWSPLAIDNTAFAPVPLDERPVDLLFAGRLTEVKNPLFALRVAQAAAERLGRTLNVRIAGSGDLEQAVRELAAASPLLDVELVGFVQQEELPALYASAKVFLFPTTWDPWGVVANEAAAAGTPVVVSPHAGAAGELVVDGVSGAVVPLAHDRWVDAVAGLLGDRAAWERQSAGAVQRVGAYTWDAAAAGFVDAIEHAARAGWDRS